MKSLKWGRLLSDAFCRSSKKPTGTNLRDEHNICFSLFLSFPFSYDFTPLDSSAVYVLSSMARQRRTSQSSGGAVSPDCDKLERCGSPQSSSSKSNRSHNSGTASGATTTKCKRPMNAFMLFAKKYRVEYTQMYPGKDNRWVLERKPILLYAQRDSGGLITEDLCPADS